MAMTATNDPAAKLAAEKKLLDACIAECTKLVQSMRAQSPVDAGRSKTKLDAIIKSVPKMPMEVKRKLLADARGFECIANTRAADAALQQALEKARKDDEAERNRLVGEARNFCNKAMSLGAASNFRTTLNRKIEIIMMTGGVEHDGPTVAKPADTAPKPTGPKS
jgi:hypothetical protein